MRLLDRCFVGIVWGGVFAMLMLFFFTKLSEQERAEYEHLKVFTFQEGVNQGRIEVFTGQVICRQIPLQGTQIELECKSRKEIEDFLRFIQPKSDIK